MKILFKENLYNEAKKHDIELNEFKLEQLEKYKELLLEWNEKMNLTNITEEQEIIVKHFVDCLECTKYIKENESVIDIGTGAGFPGIVIAVYFEGKINITLLDSLNKRLNFIKEVVNQLDIKNVEIIHSRAEEKANNSGYRENYDVAVARAVASISILSEYTSPYVKVGGRCIYMKGDNVKEEIEKSENILKTLNLKIIKEKVYELQVNKENGTESYKRVILILNKYDKTPNKYPRRYDKIKKK